MTRADDSPVPDYASRLSLADRSFIVLGAGNGMGRQTAHALAAVGARLVCVDQDPGLAEDIAKEVSGIGLALDMTDRGNVPELVAAARQAGTTADAVALKYVDEKISHRVGDGASYSIFSLAKATDPGMDAYGTLGRERARELVRVERPQVF